MRTQLAHSGCSRPQRTLRRRQTMQLSDNRGFLIWRGSDKGIFQKGSRELFDSSCEGEWMAFYWNHIGVCQKKDDWGWEVGIHMIHLAAN